MFGVSIWAKMYRLDIIREHNIWFPEDMNYEEDCLFNLEYFRHARCVGYQGIIGYTYRQNASSLSKGYRSHALASQLIAYGKRKEFVSEMGLEDQAEKLDAVMLVVFFTELNKIAASDLVPAEKIGAYQRFVDLAEVQRIFAESDKSLQYRFGRKVRKTILEKNSGKLYRLYKRKGLRGRIIGFLKDKAKKWLPEPILKIAKIPWKILKKL